VARPQHQGGRPEIVFVVIVTRRERGRLVGHSPYVTQTAQKSTGCGDLLDCVRILRHAWELEADSPPTRATNLEIVSPEMRKPAEVAGLTSGQGRGNSLSGKQEIPPT
jgi:hypothetical protein